MVDPESDLLPSIRQRSLRDHELGTVA